MAIVFYAGHGMEAGGENWLIPIDAELRNDTDVESEAISLRSVSLQVRKRNNLAWSFWTPAEIIRLQLRCSVRSAFAL